MTRLDEKVRGTRWDTARLPSSCSRHLTRRKAADEKLSTLAEGGINQNAAAATHSDGVEEAMAVAAPGRRA